MKTVSLNNIFTFLFLTLFSFTQHLYGLRVVLDPGHGGRYVEPNAVYGDKYNPFTGLFMEGFRPGASIDGLIENEEVYAIAQKAKEILDLTMTIEGRVKFYEILKKYDPNALLPTEGIEVFLSRNSGYMENYWSTDYDVNRDYRLYDHQDLLDQHHVPGLISRINQLKPVLVVSLHLTGGNPDKRGGMSAVITPGYDTYKTALKYVRAATEQERKTIRENFLKGSYGNWFISHHGRDHFEWFLCDAWIYFTGYWSKPDGLSADFDMFRGYRQNLISWSYQDKNWLKTANQHLAYTPYSTQLTYFSPQGKYWERERNQAESWRRENGPEGYGGDNFYAAEEILRFLRKGLLLHKLYNASNVPPIVEPYISTWSLPTYINAISAYLELAYLNNIHDHSRILKQKEVHAEAIAVAIYSLLYGTNMPKDSRQKDLPWGKRLDLAKYQSYHNKNYFSQVYP